MFHTAGEPPSNGSNILATIGCTANSSPAPRKLEAVSRPSSNRPRCGVTGATTTSGACLIAAGVSEVTEGPT